MSNPSQHDPGQRILLLTLALQVAVESENWDEIDTLISNREDAMAACTGTQIEPCTLQQIQVAEARVFEGLMAQRRVLLTSLESGVKAVTMHRAYAGALDTPKVAEY